VSTISVTGNYVVASDQNLSFTGGSGPIYTLTGGFFPDPSFTDQGTIQVGSNVDNATVTAVGDNGSGFFGTALIKVGLGASLIVSATGASSSAYGYSSFGFSAGVENDGTFTVSGVQTAIGDNAYSDKGFVNTGQFNVSGASAFGIRNSYGGAYANSGTLTVAGITMATGIAMGDAPGGSLTNSGAILVTASAGLAFGVTFGGPDSFAVTIVNTGTITAQYAISSSPTVFPLQTSQLLLTNSGVINGEVDAGQGPSVNTPVGTQAGAQIHNTGAINGAVHLDAGGNDLYDGHSGTLTGPLFLGGGTDTVYLGNDGETVFGGSGAGHVTGGSGADIVHGGAGDDVIDGGGGANILDGGGGTNTASYASASAGVIVSLALQGTTQDNAGAGDDRLSNFQNLLGSAFADHLTGDAGDNVIDGGSGDDVLDGGGGSNTVSYASAGAAVTVSLALQGSAQDTVGAGHDTLSNFQKLIGSAFDDHLTGDAGADTIDGGPGNDVLDGGGGVDTVSYASATAGVTVSLMLQGAVQDTGGGGHDTLTNFANLTGSAFNDTLEGDGNGNVLDGGAGTNTVSYAHAASGVTVSLALQGTAQNTVGAGTDTLSNFQNLTGSAFADVLTGDGSNNVINGGGGDDLINGGGGWDAVDGGGGSNTISFAGYASGMTINLTQGHGNDLNSVNIVNFNNIQNVIGSAFADTITGNAAANVLTGGAGGDTFVVTAGGGADTITDFSHAQGDQLDLSALGMFFSMADVLAAAHEVGSDLVINLDAGNSLTLDNVQPSDLAAGDFVFAPFIVSSGQTSTIGAGANLLVTQARPGYGLYLAGIQTNGVLINNGTINLNAGSGSNGQLVGGDTLQSTFVNNGQASVTVDTIGGAVTAGTLTNTGSLTATFLGTFPSWAIDANVANSGTISVTGGGYAISSAYLRSVQNLASGSMTGANLSRVVNLYNGGAVQNAGSISADGGVGVYLGASSGGVNGAGFASVTNGGSIIIAGAGGTGVLLSSNGGFVPPGGLPAAGQYNLVNSGVLSAATAIQFSGITAAIQNTGTITGAVVTSSADDRVVNTGTINGAVNLGSGNDSLDSHSGAINGVVTLGAGSSTATLGAEDNTVALAAGTHVVDAGGGTNTVSYASSAAGVIVNLALQGQAQATGVGIDTLSHFQKVVGSAFHDRLTAADGTSVTGGAGADTFAVSSASANATVGDFSHAQGDKVDLSNLHLFHTFADVLAAAVQSGSDTVINLGSGSLTLTGVTKTALTAQDFVLTNSTSDFGQTGQDALLFRNAASGDWGYMSANNAGGETWHPIGSSSSDYAPLGRGDFNGDGVLDTAFRQTSTGSWGFLTINPSGGETWHQAGSASLAYDAVATGDILSNGSADIVFRNAASGDWGFMSTNGSSQVWHPIGATGAAYSVVGYGDFNGDGVFDVAFRNGQTGDWGFMSVPSTGGEVWHPVGSASVAYAAVASADFLGTGQTEIVFRNAATGDWGFMQANNSGGETWHPIGPTGPGYSVIGNGDYNGDGVQDVAFRNTSTGDWGFMTVLPTGGEVWHGVGSASLAYGTI